MRPLYKGLTSIRTYLSERGIQRRNNNCLEEKVNNFGMIIGKKAVAAGLGAYMAFVSAGFGTLACAEGEEPVDGRGDFSDVSDVNSGDDDTSDVYNSSSNDDYINDDSIDGDCVIPYSGMEIKKDTTFCPGEYHLSARNHYAAISLNSAKDVTLDCGGATIIGESTCREFESGVARGGWGIAIEEQSENVTIQNCTIKNYCIGINVGDSYNIILRDLILKDNPSKDYNHFGDNIQIVSTRDVKVDGVSIEGGLNEGIYLIHSPINISIKNSSIKDVDGNGITCCDRCEDIYLEGNYIKGVGNDGISLRETTRGQIYDNQISDVGSAGIRIEKASEIIVSGNIVKEVDNGGTTIYLEESVGGRIWNNIFESPLFGKVAYDSSGDSNYWNILKTLETNIIGGPHIGGNFYSNYSGEDNNEDGIGEESYKISGGDSVDLSPLVE